MTKEATTNVTTSEPPEMETAEVSPAVAVIAGMAAAATGAAPANQLSKEFDQPIKLNQMLETTSRKLQTQLTAVSIITPRSKGIMIRVAKSLCDTQHKQSSKQAAHSSNKCARS